MSKSDPMLLDDALSKVMSTESSPRPEEAVRLGGLAIRQCALCVLLQSSRPSPVYAGRTARPLGR